jgi:hypothetical protein
MVYSQERPFCGQDYPFRLVPAAAV